MNFRQLGEEAELRPLSETALQLTGLPPDGQTLLAELVARFPSDLALLPRQDRFDTTLEIMSSSLDSASWFGNRDIRLVVWPGDLVIDGDLRDDDFAPMPALVVCGNLSVHNWLRGGMISFVGGHVKATGFVVGHHNDSALFVGGDLAAAGYLHRARPYPDRPQMRPHQIAGAVRARSLDILEATDAELEAALLEGVLSRDDEGTSVEVHSVLERASAGLPVWK